MKKYLEDRKKVFVVLTNIELLDYSAIVVLLSMMVRFKSKGIGFNGTIPKNKLLAQVFLDSGFIDALEKDFQQRDKYKITGKNKIHTHAMKSVEPQMSEVIMNEISMSVSGYKAIYKGLTRTLIELMQNSFNHAEPNEEGVKHWWLSVNVDESSKIASFSFLDYGVGIFNSLNSKTNKSRWFEWEVKLKALFNIETNADVLRLILSGKLHKTITNEHFRGKGLPGIAEAMERNLISNLHIITNNVYANVVENKFLMLPISFEGTFVYWEINNQTKNVPWQQTL